RKKKRKEIDVISSKRKQLEADSTNSVAVANSSQTDTDHMDFEQDSDCSEDLPQDLLHEDNVQSDQDIDNIDEFNNVDGLLYNLDEIQELVSNRFQDAEKSNEPVKINFEIELDSALIESIFPEFGLETQDFETIKESFHQLVNVVVLPLEYGSGYYWNVPKMYPNKRKNKFAGCVTAYLECAQRNDRKWQRSEEQPVKRKSEARVSIERYDCFGKIKLTIDPQQRRIIVQGSHQLAHLHPEYRKVEFPVAAKLWIRSNIEYNIQNSELYRRLQHENLIDAQIHTKEQ
ncbi:20075_t:CDS:1, partial [Racocetra fulgida]